MAQRVVKLKWQWVGLIACRKQMAGGVEEFSSGDRIIEDAA